MREGDGTLRPLFPRPYPTTVLRLFPTTQFSSEQLPSSTPCLLSPSSLFWLSFPPIISRQDFRSSSRILHIRRPHMDYKRIRRPPPFLLHCLCTRCNCRANIYGISCEPRTIDSFSDFLATTDSPRRQWVLPTGSNLPPPVALVRHLL